MPGIGVFHKPDLEFETAKTASFTAAAGYIYPVNLGSVTADLTLTFPSSPTTDDRFAVYVSSTHSSGGTSTNFADRPYFCVEPANATSINGSSYSADAGEGSGEYGLWLRGEYMEYVYNGDESTWEIAVDGRKAMYAKTTKTSTQSIGNGTLVTITYASDLSDDAALHSTSSNTDRVYIKRSGVYQMIVGVKWADDSTSYRYVEIADSGTAFQIDRRPGLNTNETTMAAIKDLSARDYIGVGVFQATGSALNLAADQNTLTIRELF